MAWEELDAILIENREESRNEDGIWYCPLCLEHLDENDAGVRNCPYGHWRSDG